MDYFASEEVTPKRIPVTDLNNEYNKQDNSPKTAQNCNYYYSSTNTKEEYSSSEGCVEFNYAEVASENELDETTEDYSISREYGERNHTSTDESNLLVESVIYFNSLKTYPEKMVKSGQNKNHTSRALSSGLMSQIDAHYNHKLQRYISESGNTALYQYMLPTAPNPLKSHLPEYTIPSLIESKIQIDEAVKQAAVNPVFHKYQLLGDSQLLRFSEVVLGIRRWRPRGDRSRIGYCVSGQSVAELGARIRASECRLKTHVIVLIGTNDMRKNTDVFRIIEAYSDLVDQLEARCDRIVLLTVPPLPLMHDQDPQMHIDQLKIVNGFIKDLANGRNIFVLDFCSLFISFDNTVSKDYFEQFLRRDKVDMIHLNKCGLRMLRTLLDTQYFDRYRI